MENHNRPLLPIARARALSSITDGAARPLLSLVQCTRFRRRTERPPPSSSGTLPWPSSERGRHPTVAVRLILPRDDLHVFRAMVPARNVTGPGFAAVSLWYLLAASTPAVGRPSASPPSFDRCQLVQPLQAEIAAYRPVVQRVLQYVTRGPYKGRTWAELARFADTFGSRLAGTPNLEDAIDYTMDKLRAENLENVHGERVEFTAWQRYPTN